MTNISGYLYNPSGVVIATGVIRLTLQQDIVTAGGLKVAPFVTEFDLSEAVGGLFDVDVYATVGATPAGVSYKVEYDPDPDDDTQPARTKDGYWSNYWAVPDTPTVAMGSFASALRGEASANYVPTAGHGVWTDVAFSAGHFSGLGSMTWVVESGDVGYFAYMRMGSTVWVNFVLTATVVGGTPHASLVVTVPGSLTAAGASTGPLKYTSGGTTAMGSCSIDAGNTLITLTKVDGSTWANGTTAVRGNLCFEV
jgi:hypothetical protein